MKRLLLAGASLTALAAGAFWLVGRRANDQGVANTPPALPERRERAAKAGRNVLMYFIVPVWIAAGAADWACHCASDIEHTAGPEETLLHLLLLAEMGLPSLAGLLLEINASVFALMLAAFLLHEATALWDVRYAVSLRNVSPIEQHVHSFLEMMPLAGFAMLVALHPGQFGALFGLGGEEPELRLQGKRDKLSGRYVVSVIAAIAAFNVLPYIEELRRGIRARQDRKPDEMS
jgi:hypothetical protein